MFLQFFSCHFAKLRTEQGDFEIVVRDHTLDTVLVRYTEDDKIETGEHGKWRKFSISKIISQK